MNSYLPFICLNRKRLAPWRQMNTSRSILSWRRSLMMKSVMTTGAIDQLRLFWHQLVAVWWNFPNFSVPSLLNNKYNHVVFRVIWLLLVWRFELQQNHVRKLDFLCEATEISFIIHIKAGFESNKLYLRSRFPFISIRVHNDSSMVLVNHPHYCVLHLIWPLWYWKAVSWVSGIIHCCVAVGYSDLIAFNQWKSFKRWLLSYSMHRLLTSIFCGKGGWMVFFLHH